MPTNSLRVTLLAPGCFTAIARAEDDAPTPPAGELAPEVNESKAVATQSQAYEQSLAAALQQPVPELGALPVALYQFQSESGESAPEHCVCAELIHLQADKDNARLVPEAALNIDSKESKELLDSLNELINPDGLNVHRSAGGHIYLTGMPAAALDTWPAHAVANGKIANSLPRQSNAGDWRRLLTEVQMLFHAHPVNAARAELNQLPINGMWFWGGNQSVSVSPVTNMLLVADDAYARGLGAALNLNTESLASSSWENLVRDYLSGSENNDASIDEIVMVDLSAYQAWLSGDQVALAQAKDQLQTQWITPLQKAVTNDLVAEFILDGCEGQAIVERPLQRGARGLSDSSWLWKLLPQRFIPSWLAQTKDKKS